MIVSYNFDFLIDTHFLDLFDFGRCSMQIRSQTKSHITFFFFPIHLNSKTLYLMDIYFL